MEGTVCLESAARLHGARVMAQSQSVDIITSWKPNGLKRRPCPRRPARVPSRDASPAERRRLLEARPIVRHHMPLAAGDVVYLAPGARHALTAVTPCRLQLVMVEVASEDA